jgi:glycosyltransferase involved in cell wall biosynthesis
VARERGAVDDGVRGGDRKAPRAIVTNRLRIGVDARELIGATTGVGRYLGELLRRWTMRPDSYRRTFVLYAPKPLPLSLPAGTFEARILGRGRGTLWEQTYLRRAVREDPLDAFFAPAYTAPLGVKIPLAVTIHDISFVAHPEWFRAREGFRRRWLTRRAASNARIVFTDSEFSRNEIENHLSVEPSRIEVIPPGVASPARKPGAPLAREPLVLFVGSLFNRRRLPDLIAAFARATADLPHARLAIVGDNRTWPKQNLAAAAAAHGVAKRIAFKRYITDVELESLYARASVFAFLSEYEGFGLTPLEALSYGVPPIVGDTPVAREVYGNAAEFVPIGDVAGTASAIRRFLIDPPAAAPLLLRAPAILRRYSWDTAADRTLEALERIARP